MIQHNPDVPTPSASVPNSTPGPAHVSIPAQAEVSIPPQPLIPDPSSHPAPNPQPIFPRADGETPRAFNAFMTFFNLGHSRSLTAAADQLDEKIDSLKKWSSRFRWNDRIQAFNSGLLQQQAEAEAARRAQQAADWAQRTAQFRECEWLTSQKVIAAVQCWLDSFGDEALEKMSLAQISRALEISFRIGRQSLNGANLPEGPVLVPLQLELSAALKKAYAEPPPEQIQAPSAPAKLPVQIDPAKN